MNHDVLKNTFYSTAMAVYKVLLDEYKNEDVAKRNTLKIAKEVLVEFGMKGDIYKTHSQLLERYKKTSDEQVKFELYKKLETLDNAITIIKEVNGIG